MDEPEVSEDGQDGFAGHAVVALKIAKREGKRILSPFQYACAVDLVKRLSDFGNREATVDLDIRQIGDFWELRLMGGVFRNINLRVYFSFESERKEVVVLMAYKKEEDRQVSPHILVTLADRRDDYLSGVLHNGASVYRG